jgi:hypothetical protein
LRPKVALRVLRASPSCICAKVFLLFARATNIAAQDRNPSRFAGSAIDIFFVAFASSW